MKYYLIIVLNVLLLSQNLRGENSAVTLEEIAQETLDHISHLDLRTSNSVHNTEFDIDISKLLIMRLFYTYWCFDRFSNYEINDSDALTLCQIQIGSLLSHYLGVAQCTEYRDHALLYIARNYPSIKTAFCTLKSQLTHYTFDHTFLRISDTENHSIYIDPWLPFYGASWADLFLKLKEVGFYLGRSRVNVVCQDILFDLNSLLKDIDKSQIIESWDLFEKTFSYEIEVGLKIETHGQRNKKYRVPLYSRPTLQ